MCKMLMGLANGNVILALEVRIKFKKNVQYFYVFFKRVATIYHL
jgi:hypothetical protein